MQGLDIDILLNCIDKTVPTGDDIRADYSPTSLYYKLRDARADARAAERAADANPAEAVTPPEWRNVRKLASQILAEKAKDLEVAAWLTESLVRSDGLAGLAFGATLIEGLATRYWDTLYPMPDEDGMETRVAPVTGLNGEGGDGTLIQPLRKLELFNDRNGEPVMLFQYEQSAELQTLADPQRIEARIAAGVVPYDTMTAAARAAPAGHYAALMADLRAATAAWSTMGETLDRLAGPDAPPTRRVADVLSLIGDFLTRYAPAAASADVGDSAVADMVQTDTPAGGAPAPVGMAAPRPPVTREDALARLAEVAEFFRRAEPQSPLAYTLEEAIRRGRMTWPELVAELVEDEQARNGILLRLGLPVTSS
ncbi:type VI secretion protein ImpA [Komagataeibacter intermedius AF2]|uniref:Type VI secretion protein ImpA n=1 Tax=Komagataeibacter intermedius AF2 TaxID=1458464 RepID=A0A0N0MEL7_9PROT|nr:type VI secretion system protein TssA [Komagataeibacter intermedius]KPH86593.1 type VI secretion protein ImpA [Komagataeibacter intermedius AF2]